MPEPTADDLRRRREWGQSLAERRKAQQLTQVELATAAGIQQATVSQIERGEHSGSERTRIALARALRLEVHELFPYPPTAAEVAS